MKKILLDSHVLLWWLSEPERLGKFANQLLTNIPASISSMAIFELTQKQRNKKLDPTIDFFAEAAREQIDVISFDEAVTKVYRAMPQLSWRDPFDHMIIAHSVATRSQLLTADAKILACGWQALDLIDARK